MYNLPKTEQYRAKGIEAAASCQPSHIARQWDNYARVTFM